MTRSLLVLALLGALAGCGTITVQTNPNAFSVRGDTETLRAGQTLALDNAYPAEARMTIAPGERLHWDADMRQLTDTAIQILSRHLARNGISVAPQAPKTIALRVRDVLMVATFDTRVQTSLVLEARFGDETATAMQVENTSPDGAARSAGEAILSAVTLLLNDARFVGYVNR